ncbi:hypothetical protein EMIHUDRAFT_195240 [Emiliania huxleyi CCMP1516]|uniref:RING-type domain-containing protein n=2 Tax=Emiliania huxleyi TaxID=2903 RepID=A0A0D3JH58_EMIH1|nr:hypothetical protein EMIHUDRAFT_195240 [Emiliania huxleyi CCMP1516]EOD22843.1 hypothetical protein EMIHUDRAFT_195240 [Emiliania huxleyi CCMP1516]|eukprot:XP_005775272.1 hypothetical protein EMIHUDRAFT_195240 [Emiliania huxleyi CCMP1516]
MGEQLPPSGRAELRVPALFVFTCGKGNEVKLRVWIDGLICATVAFGLGTAVWAPPPDAAMGMEPPERLVATAPSPSKKSPEGLAEPPPTTFMVTADAFHTAALGKGAEPSESVVRPTPSLTGSAPSDGFVQEIPSLSNNSLEFVFSKLGQQLGGPGRSVLVCFFILLTSWLLYGKEYVHAIAPLIVSTWSEGGITSIFRLLLEWVSGYGLIQGLIYVCVALLFAVSSFYVFEKLMNGAEFAVLGAISLADANFETGRPPAESTIGGQTTCIICFTNPKSHLATPCGHQCACGRCSARLEKCPICRAPVTGWFEVHVA